MFFKKILILVAALGEEETKALLADWGTTYKQGTNQLLRHMPKQSDYGDGK